MISTCFIFLSCSKDSSKESSLQSEDTSQNSATTSENPVSQMKDIELMVIEHNKDLDQWQLAIHVLGNWDNSNTTKILQQTHSESIIRQKHNFLWLLERGEEPERIVQYDPNDLSQPYNAFTFADNERVYPNDITICNDKVFVTLFESTDLLVLDAGNFQEITRISLETHADEDGLPEASTLICKDNYVFVSLHRIDRRDTPSTQLGSQWVVFDPTSYEEIAIFDDQGYRSDGSRRSHAHRQGVGHGGQPKGRRACCAHPAQRRRHPSSWLLQMPSMCFPERLLKRRDGL